MLGFVERPVRRKVPMLLRIDTLFKHFLATLGVILLGPPVLVRTSYLRSGK